MSDEYAEAAANIKVNLTILERDQNIIIVTNTVEKTHEMSLVRGEECDVTLPSGERGKVR